MIGSCQCLIMPCNNAKSLLTPFLLLQGHNWNHGKKHNKDYQSYLYAMKCVYIVINVTIVYMILSSLLWPISYTTIYQGSARKMMFIENKQSWANKNLNFWRSFTYMWFKWFGCAEKNIRYLIKWARGKVGWSMNLSIWVNGIGNRLNVLFIEHLY